MYGRRVRRDLCDKFSLLNCICLYADMRSAHEEVDNDDVIYRLNAHHNTRTLSAEEKLKVRAAAPAARRV